MEKVWILSIATLIFLLLCLIGYFILKRYAAEEFGKKWIKAGRSKLYFWQSIFFMSTAGTALLMYLLKLGNLVTF